MDLLLVPANLLLAGEYAVTEEGHLGFALAVRKYVVATVEPARSLEIVGRLGRRGEESFGGIDDGQEFPHIAARSICSELELDHGSIGARIVIDSSEFYDQTGRKLGFGSSAAVVVALSHALTHASRVVIPRTALARAAVLAHREAQGGRGSGYDVLASTFGGIGVVEGGTAPVWIPVDAPWCRTIGLLSNDASVHTPGAVGRYERWSLEEPDAHMRFLVESDDAVRALQKASGYDEAASALRRAKAAGTVLGRAIAVPAEVNHTIASTIADREDVECKSLGAGDELCGCISKNGDFPSLAREETVDREGARWE